MKNVLKLFELFRTRDAQRILHGTNEQVVCRRRVLSIRTASSQCAVAGSLAPREKPIVWGVYTVCMDGISISRYSVAAAEFYGRQTVKYINIPDGTILSVIVHRRTVLGTSGKNSDNEKPSGPLVTDHRKRGQYVITTSSGGRSRIR